MMITMMMMIIVLMPSRYGGPNQQYNALLEMRALSSRNQHTRGISKGLQALLSAYTASHMKHANANKQGLSMAGHTPAISIGVQFIVTTQELHTVHSSHKTQSSESTTTVCIPRAMTSERKRNNHAFSDHTESLLRQQPGKQWVESMRLTCSHGSGVTYSATQSLDPDFRKHHNSMQFSTDIQEQWVE